MHPLIDGEKVIFLGAGASRPFGIKTLEEMGQNLIEILEHNDYGDLVGQMKSGLSKYGMTLDFEAVYGIIEGLTNLEDSIRQSGPFTAYVAKDLKDYYKKDLKSILQLLRKFIWKECSLKRAYEEKIVKVYDELFRLAKESQFRDKRYIPNREQQTSSLVNVGNTVETQVDVGKTIVTTNYDHIIEIYHRAKNQSYIDGFRQSNDPAKSSLDLSVFSERAHDRWLLKLHGSLYQYKFKNSIFKTLEAPEKLSTKTMIQENMMIYPTQEKSMLKHPYHNFYSIFKAQEWTKLIAIGYSFRDYPINTAIIENLEKNSNSSLIIINRNPEKAINNLGEQTMSNYNDRIIPIKGRFGDDAVFIKLKIALKVDNRERYEIRLREKREELRQIFGLTRESDETA
jgi:hypothetical protein